MKLNKNKNSERTCSFFEEMLMWTSYRYAIGRQSYVESLADEIPQHYYSRLSPDRRLFTAEDIRKEIMSHLSCMSPFSFKIRRMYNDDPYNPLDALFAFYNKENVTTERDAWKYSSVEYDAHTDTYTFDMIAGEPALNTWINRNTLNNLASWDRCASCFDTDHHVFVNGVEYFKSWKPKTITVDNTEGKTGDDKLYNICIKADFGWEPVWMELNTYLKDGEYSRYMDDATFQEFKSKEEK